MGRERALRCAEFDAELAAAIRNFDVSIPFKVDLAFRFPQPRHGMTGILMEAKSGKQDASDTVYQLKTYRASIPRSDGERWLVWGVAEQAGAVTSEHCEVIRERIQSGNGDVWAFSRADDIPFVLASSFGSAGADVRAVGGSNSQEALG